MAAVMKCLKNMCLQDFHPEKLIQIPRMADTPRTAVAKKAKVDFKFTQFTLLPPAVANGLIIVGTEGNDGDCSFPLREFLVWIGAAVLGVYILGILGKYAFWWVINDRIPLRASIWLLLVFEYTTLLLAFLEVAAVVAMSAFIFSKLAIVQYERGKPHFCEKRIVLFTVILFGVILICLGLAIIAFAVILGFRIHHAWTGKPSPPPKYVVRRGIGPDYYVLAESGQLTPVEEESGDESDDDPTLSAPSEWSGRQRPPGSVHANLESEAADGHPNNAFFRKTNF